MLIKLLSSLSISLLLSFSITSVSSLQATSVKSSMIKKSKPNSEEIYLLTRRLNNLEQHLMQLEQIGTSEQMVEVLLDIKEEIEAVYDFKFSLSEAIDKMRRKLMRQIAGPNYLSQEITGYLFYHFDQFKSLQKKQRKKRNLLRQGKAFTRQEGVFSSTSNFEEAPVQQNGKGLYGKTDPKEYKKLSTQLSWGISLTLAGAFIRIVPSLKSLGDCMQVTGMDFCKVNVMERKKEEDKKNTPEKNKLEKNKLEKNKTEKNKHDQREIEEE